MPSKYFSIDTSSTNWCGVHALSILLYADQFHYSRDPNHYQSSLNSNILMPLRNPEDRIVDNNESSIRTNSQERITRYIRQNLEKKKQQPDQRINVDQAMESKQTTDIINTLTEINMFFNTRQQNNGQLEAISADVLKNNLSPLVYKLYSQMTGLVLCKVPIGNNQYSLKNWRTKLKILETVIGDRKVCNDFFYNVNRNEMVRSGDGDELIHYRTDLRNRLDAMEVGENNSDCLSVGDVTALIEPTYRSPLYQFSTEMMENMTRLFCSPTRRPQVNAHSALFMHDFDLWGSDDPFVIKGENRHFKLLIKANGPHITPQSLEQMASENAAPPPPPPPSGNNRNPPGNNNFPHNGFNLAPNHTFFESWYSFLMIILAALAVIAGIYLMFRKEAEPNSPQNNTKINNNRQRRETNGANQQTNPANDAKLDNVLAEPVRPVSFHPKKTFSETTPARSSKQSCYPSGRIKPQKTRYNPVQTWPGKH